jgi:two-component system, chemotaxis family, chemotaxis protein CheY
MSKKILVIDDSPAIRQQVSLCLSRSGFEIVEATDGRDALTKVDSCALAVCDVNMPGMNGIEFVKEMFQRGSKMPIVMLTTEGRPELIAEAKKAGAKGWMVKPFKPEQLIAVVQKLAA